MSKIRNVPILLNCRRNRIVALRCSLKTPSDRFNSVKRLLNNSRLTLKHTRMSLKRWKETSFVSRTIIRSSELRFSTRCAARRKICRTKSTPLINSSVNSPLSCRRRSRMLETWRRTRCVNKKKNSLTVSQANSKRSTLSLINRWIT